jgi:predicted DNA-binding protein
MKTQRKTVDRHSKDTKQLNVFIPLVVYKKLHALAEADVRSASAYVRLILVRYVQDVEAKEKAAAVQSVAPQQPSITKTA